MGRVAGALEIQFEDTGAVDRDLYGTTTAAINMQTSEYAASAPGALGWKNPRPELTDWSVDAAFNQDVDGGYLEVSQAEIVALWFAKTQVDIVVTAPNGVTYSGAAFVANVSEPTADQAAAVFNVRLRGTGVLTIDNPGFPWGDPEDILLLTPDSITTSGTALDTWTDLSGEGNHLSALSSGFTSPEVQEESLIGNTVYTQWELALPGSGRIGKASTDTENSVEDLRTNQGHLFMVVKVSSEQERIFSVVNPGGVDNFFINNVGGTLQVTPAGDSLDKIESAGFNDGAWHLVEYVSDYDAGTLELWVDGAQVDSDSALASGGLWGAGADYRINIFAAFGKDNQHAYPCSIALVKWMAGFPDAARIQEIRDYVEDSWGITIA